MTKKLQIDWTRCEGHGLCAEVFPEAIIRDEWGYPIFTKRELATGDMVQARRAIALCPALALRLETTDAPLAQVARRPSRR